jgi:hypothetical protein
MNILESRLGLWVIRDVIPSIRFSTGYCSINGQQYNQGYTLLEPGDILVSRDNHRLSTLLVPGFWTHASVCVDKMVGVRDDYEIGEMTRIGYTKSTFFDLCRENDHIAILRPDWEDDYRNLFIEACKAYEQTGYDFSFRKGVASLYCSELVYACDFGDRLGLNNNKVVLPDHIFDKLKNNIVWRV